MRNREEIERLLAEEGDPAARHSLEALVSRLDAQRPVPAPGFRSRLRRGLLDQAGAGERRLPLVRRLIAVYATSGSLLLAVAAVGIAGVGPLAA
jgi:hypothetical protein